MSIPMVRIGSIASWGNRKGERGANVDLQAAELWDSGEDRLSTLDVARTRNKWNESKWFDVLAVLVIAVISVVICYMLGWI